MIQYKIYNTIMHSMHMLIILTSLLGFLLTDLLAWYIIFQASILCSWIGYGFYDKRWGRCIITEIQWNIKDTYGKRPETESYILYWVKYKFGINSEEKNVDIYITTIFAVTFLVGIGRFMDLIP